MDLLYFLRVLLKRKWLILGLSFAAVVATFVFKIFQKPLYESRAQYSTGFTIDRVRLADGSAVADLYAADTKFDNVIETFKSPRVIGTISYKLLLHDLENPSGAWRQLTEKEKESKVYKSINTDTVITVLNEKVAKGELLRSDIPDEREILEFLKLYKYDYQQLLWNLNIARVNKTDYLDITYKSENPYLSAWVVNAMGNEFLNYYRNLNFQRTNENIASIRQMEAQQQRVIDSLNSTLLAEKVSQGSVDPASVSASAMETVKDLEGRYADEKSRYDLNANRISFLRKELDALTSRGSSTNTELLDLMDQRARLEAQLIAKGGNDAQIEQELSTVRNKILAKSGTNVTNARTGDRIEELRRQINEATANMNAAKSTMDDYSSRMNYYHGLTRLNPGSGVKMDVIRTQLEVEQKQLATLKEKLNQAEGLSKDDPSMNFTQTLVGQPPVEPQSRQIPMAMGISGMSVFFLTSFFFLFLEVFRSAIKTPYGFQKNVDIPLVGVANNIRLKPDLLPSVLLDEEVKKRPNLTLFKNNIRKLRYEIIESGHKVFLFASTGAGTGKSFLIESLAISMLLLKKRVLIIDFNLHNNTLTRRFNAESTIQALNEKGNPNLPFSLQKLISKTEFDHISVIGCDETDQTPAEVLYRIDFQSLLDNLKENFDYIFMESSALNKYSDTKELVQYGESVVSVFSAEQQITQADQPSVAYIQGLGEKNFGAVLNNVLSENLNY